MSGDIDTWEEAVKKCKSILQEFVPEHERIELMIHFRIFTPRYGDPETAETPEVALEKAVGYDKAEKQIQFMETHYWYKKGTKER